MNGQGLIDSEILRIYPASRLVESGPNPLVKPQVPSE
jgi:hypothetical protein